MLQRIIFLVFISIFLATSCKKEDVITDFEGTKALVLRDCTGTYLKINQKDYHVCNTNLTNRFSDNSFVEVIYTKISVCTGEANNGIVCMMYRENEGWIEIKNIK